MISCKCVHSFPIIRTRMSSSQFGAAIVFGRRGNQVGKQSCALELHGIVTAYEKLSRVVEDELRNIQQTSSSRNKIGIPWNAELIEPTKASALVYAKVYMELVLIEVERLKTVWNPSISQPLGSVVDPKSLLNAAVTFAFKVHQFVGGFDTECNEILQKVEAEFSSYKGGA